MKTILITLSLFGLGWLFVHSIKSGTQSILGRTYKVTGGKVIYHYPVPGLWARRKKKEVQGADPLTFKALTPYFGRDQHGGYYDGNLIPESHGPSFEALKRNYAKDQNRVYLRSEVISHDPIHFQFVAKSMATLFAKDSKQVFLNGKPMEGADAPSFESLKGITWLRDVNAGYYKSTRLPGSNGKTFRALNEDFATDGTSCWHGTKQIPGADPASFRPISQPYSKDKNHVYFSDKILSDDPKGFRLYKGRNPNFGRYAVDSRVVYFGRELLAGADRSTFKELSGGYAQDNRRVYMGKYIMKEADPSTFEVLNRYYSRDQHFVFYKGKKMEGADPDSFRVDENTRYKGEDAFRKYRSGKVVGEKGNS